MALKGPGRHPLTGRVLFRNYDDRALADCGRPPTPYSAWAFVTLSSRMSILFPAKVCRTPNTIGIALHRRCACPRAEYPVLRTRVTGWTTSSRHERTGRHVGQ
jgi:hypothetical protein